MVAVAAVILMVLSTFVFIGTSDESDASANDWKCTITISESTLTTKYEKGGAALADTSPVNGISRSAGSWAFDSNGYGPFNCFYAAFDSTGTMVCHLNPNNLKQAVDGTDISGQGYNIMWCLPKIYLSTSGSTLTMSSSSSDGTLASAFTIGGTSYNYLALGVYEATYDSVALGSKSGQTPKASTSLADYRTCAKAGSVDGGITLLWNYHMYELYRMCSLAVMENFDSQAQIGYGNASGSASSTTGQTDSYGPYYGTSSADTKGAKLFIENAWGSLWEYVDDAWWSSGLYAGQNLNPTSNTSNKVKTSVTSGISGYGTKPYSTQLDSWGLPTATVSSNSSAAPDYFYSKSSGCALVVGGDWGYGAYAGLSSLSNSGGGGYSNGGSRLAYLFADDSAATPTVTLDHSDLTGNNGDATGLPVKVDIVEGAKYPDLNTYESNPSIAAGWTHTGWLVNGVEYEPGATITNTDSHTAKSVWVEPKNIMFDHGALVGLLNGTSLGTDGLPDTKRIVDANTTYPDLNTECPTNSAIAAGYRHVGWYVNEVFYNIGAAVVSQTKHTAYSVWIVPQITITFYVEGQEYSTLTVPKGSCGVVFTPKMVEGVFEGWYYTSDFASGQKYDSSKVLNQDVSLYAKGVPPLEFTSIPTASATITSVNPYGLVYFDATQSTGKYQIHWDFGDGNTSDESIAYNTYTQPGKYNVTLTVTNLYGDVATETYTVTVGEEEATDDGGDRTLLMVISCLAAIVLAGVFVRRFV